MNMSPVRKTYIGCQLLVKLVKSFDNLFNQGLLNSGRVHQYELQLESHAGHELTRKSPTRRNAPFQNANHLKHLLYQVMRLDHVLKINQVRLRQSLYRLFGHHHSILKFFLV